MDSIEITILSIIFMIGLGYILKKIDFFGEKDIVSFNKIVMYIFLPFMVFQVWYNADLSLIPELGILPFVILFSSLITGIVSYLILKQLKFDDNKLWSVLVTIMIANTAFMGYPITLGSFGQEGLLMAVFCDLGSLTMFLLLSFVLAFKFGGSAKKSIRMILLFPPLWAVILGILFNLFNIPLGDVLDSAFSYLEDGAIPLIMIALGLSIDLSAISRSKSMIIFTSVMKLLFFPFIAFLLVSQIGLLNLEHTIPIVEAAMPSAMLSLILSITYKLDYELTSDCILINTVISLITLPLIVMIL